MDGTLVGKGGSLFAALTAKPILTAAQALFAAHQIGLRVVLMSGRTRAKLHETGRLRGIHDAVAELGTVLVVDGTAELMWGHAPARLGETPAQALQRSDALATQAAAIGDAPTDFELAGVVGAMVVVANGTWALDPSAGVPDTVITTGGSAGQGGAEAVNALLARTRATDPSHSSREQ